ncbi:MAG: EVE domain-containing protein [Chthoniobacterales bacterium]|jgi:predicted RNA-binding protein with PUA-like domain
MANHWLVKSEPSAYSWADLIREKQTAWTGVRNFQARNNLRAMKKGDLVLFYQSVTDPSVRGITKVVKEAYPDPTAKEGDWSCVDLAAVKPLPSPVTLQEIKGEKSLAEISLIKQSRLSVMPIAPKEYEQILGMGGI